MVITYFENEDFKKSSCLNRILWKFVDFLQKKSKSSLRKMATICYQNNGLSGFRSGTNYNM
jgi:hypothetical protein